MEGVPARLCRELRDEINNRRDLNSAQSLLLKGYEKHV